MDDVFTIASGGALDLSNVDNIINPKVDSSDVKLKMSDVVVDNIQIIDGEASADISGVDTAPIVTADTNIVFGTYAGDGDLLIDIPQVIDTI